MNDLPRSASYPNLVTIRRTLKGSPQVRPGKAQSYQADSGRAIFYEFRGRGTPPNDVGRPGDFYWDITFPFILYICMTVKSWTPWNPYASSGSHLLAQHPIFYDRYLWVNVGKTSSDLTWFSSMALAKVDLGVKTGHALGLETQELLACALHSESKKMESLALNLADNKKRHVAEVRRRLQNCVPIGLSMTPFPLFGEKEENLISELKDAHETEKKLRAEVQTLKDHVNAPADTEKKLRDEVQALRTQVQTLKDEVETRRNDAPTLKNANVAVETLLEEARRSAKTSVENISRTLKRKYEELESAVQMNEELAARHAQAEARIQEVEKAREDTVKNAATREQDLMNRLNKANHTLDALKDEISGFVSRAQAHLGST